MPVPAFRNKETVGWAHGATGYRYLEIVGRFRVKKGKGLHILHHRARVVLTSYVSNRFHPQESFPFLYVFREESWTELT